MSNRKRRDGEPTADDLQQARDNCDEHTESFKDPGQCVHCGTPMDLPRSDDAVEDLSKVLPPSDQADGSETAAPSAEDVAERQADATADSAPAVGGEVADDGSNSKSRYEIIKEKFDRLKEIKAAQKVLRDEASEIVDDLEKQQGVNRGGLSEVRKLFGLDAATIKAREESRKELFDLLIKPKLDEATAGEERE